MVCPYMYVIHDPLDIIALVAARRVCLST